MSTRVCFKDTNITRVASVKQLAANRKVLTDRISRLESNITAFVASVESVTFNVNEDDAPKWMNNWEAQLLSGKIDR